MSAVIFHGIPWPVLACALLVWGFAPGAVLRLIVLLYDLDHPRRRELLGELCSVPRIERPFWVAEQLETALFEGVGGRFTAWRARRPVPALVYILEPGGEVVALHVSLAAELQRPDVQPDRLWRGISQALAGHYHVVRYPHMDAQREAELLLGEGVLARQAQHWDAPLEDYPEGGFVWMRVKWLSRAYRLCG